MKKKEIIPPRSMGLRLKIIQALVAFGIFVIILIWILLAKLDSNDQKQKSQKNQSEKAKLKEMATLSVDDLDRFNQTLSKILVPRIVDTPSHNDVQKFIESYLHQLGWSVDLDQFEEDTPFGRKKFTNIIGTFDTNACKRIVLACHYDSKYFADFEFLAATDSAVPCTMILELIKILNPKLRANQNNQHISLQVIFFDGEEAFERWSEMDSLYGSRHLAARLNSLAFRSDVCGSNVLTELNRIETLILLDLIGEASPRFCPHSSSTYKMFKHLNQIENRLNRMKLLESKRQSGTDYFSRCAFGTSSVEDDHVPFERLGVPILHLISTPFPPNWHQIGDNGRNLHYSTIRNLMRILLVFLKEQLKL
ncbi:glutaminyl-peptide cyclotransferase-like protein [Sarcoptes scabiei]|uniref:Glutaminyl-peptide cyclotransferase n=1 Tax=Sarcoptes scabiei TaxID=52283 RepID=A0A132A2H9_SARSC|nr:glutaminyl-peptide cyclotransferase-like protein [Sarcoptes scabiei]